jgi:hypothetical protein
MFRFVRKHTEKILFPTRYTLEGYPENRESKVEMFFALSWTLSKPIELNLRSGSVV